MTHSLPFQESVWFYKFNFIATWFPHCAFRKHSQCLEIMQIMGPNNFQVSDFFSDNLIQYLHKLAETFLQAKQLPFCQPLLILSLNLCELSPTRISTSFIKHWIASSEWTFLVKSIIGMPGLYRHVLWALWKYHLTTDSGWLLNVSFLCNSISCFVNFIKIGVSFHNR